jgi:hypothetical protein
MVESKPRKARIPRTRRKYQMYAAMGGMSKSNRHHEETDR